MIKARPPLVRHRLRPPGGGEWRGRIPRLFGLATMLTACAVVVSALCVPVTVFGAAASQTPTTLASERAIPSGSVQSVVAERLDPTPRVSQGALLATLPWGEGEGQVGLARPSEGLTRGPEALAVAPDGRVAILDSVNHRVVFLSSTGTPQGASALTLSEPRFLAADNNSLYVLDCDCDRRLVMLDWSGSIRGSYALPQLPDVVTGLFATAGGPLVEVAHDAVFGLVAQGLTSAAESPTALAASEGQPNRMTLKVTSGRPSNGTPGRSVKATYVPGQNPRITTVDSAGGAAGSQHAAAVDLGLPRNRSIEHLVSVDQDNTGHLVVGARLYDSANSGEQACLVVRRFVFGNEGALHSVRDVARTANEKDALVLVDSSVAYVGQPYVVAPDGRVLQPVATETGYCIYVHEFDPSKRVADQKEILP